MVSRLFCFSLMFCWSHEIQCLIFFFKFKLVSFPCDDTTRASRQSVFVFLKTDFKTRCWHPARPVANNLCATSESYQWRSTRPGGQCLYCTNWWITKLKECHPRCVYQNYNGLIINNGSQKHNCIYKCNNLPTTCFGLIRPSSGWKYSVRGKVICLI